jgi:serine/threonine protein kinase
MPAKYYLNKPGEKPGYSADIYALGVVIYEMLTGRRPFSGNGHEVALKHTWEIPVAPSKVRPELNIPPAVDQVVLKSLAKQPSERQKSIELLAQELRESIKTSLKLELPTQAEVIEHENNQGPEIVKPIASSITSKPLTKTFFLALAGVFLMGLLAILLYFKPLGSLSGQRNATASGSPSPSAVPILNMTVFLTRLDKRGKENPVSPSTTFYSGEGVKINIQAGQKGFLYILSRGSSGKVSMLYPDAQIQGGDNQIVKGEVIGIPTDGGWFKFSNEPGTETLYLVFAENKTERLIMEFENARSQDKIALPEDLKRQAVDFGGANGCLKGEGPLLVGVLNLSHLP